MPLDPSQTATDIVNALKGADSGMTSAEQTAAQSTWVAIITALYNRIKSDMQVASTGTSVSGGAVTTTSSSIT